MPDTDDLLALRYGAGNAPRLAASTAAIDLMLNHRSVRAYRPDPLAPGQLEMILAAAQSAASSSNLQTASVVVVTDAKAKQRFADLSGGQKHIAECPVYLLFVADLSRLARVAASVDMPHAGLDWFEMFLVAAVDAALMGQNACLAAESLGLGTVYIGAMRNHPEEVAAEIGLPPGAAVVFGLCIGHAAAGAEGAIKPRLPQAAVVHHGRYRTDGEPALIEGYNRAMADFYARERMNVKVLWDLHSARRVAGPEALSGRDRLFPALKGMGLMTAEL